MAQQIKISAQLLLPEEKKVLSAVADDLAALRAAFVTLTAKLDLDAGVTDTTYASLCNPAAMQTVK